jgi:hypothetical protein
MPAFGWLHRYVTLTMSRGLKPTDVPDVYKVRIYVGTRPTMSKVDAAAVKEITKFQQEAGYVSFEIKGRRYIFFPSAYEYTVQLSRS